MKKFFFVQLNRKADLRTKMAQLTVGAVSFIDARKDSKGRKMSFVHADKVPAEILGWGEELAAIRHEVHSQPELGFDTEKTVARIVKVLSGWGIENIDTELVKGGVIVVVDGERPGKTVALRADIDALGMDDTSGKPWKSCIAGHAHACGHDGHQTWLMGTLRYLNVHRDFPGRVVGIFQPAEEPAKGARAVVESGLFQKYDIAEIYGAHTEPMLEKGVFGFRVGPLQASCDYFWLSIKGKSTHGGRPHLGIDPVPAAAELINAAQSIISRKVNPIDTAVLSICAVNAGRYETPNVVPNEVKISGTARTFQPATRKLVEETFKAMLDNISRAHGCTSEIKYEHSIPSVINDEAATKAAVAVAEKLFGSAAVRPNIDPFMSSEDFAEYQQIVPGCMMRVGVRDEEHTSSVHSTSFDFNDEVLPAAVALLAGIARSRLEALGN